jgi:DNA-binding transcriptional MerR regulator
LRYYRTLGVIDAPTEGGGTGFGERHFLQACAVRVLQAEGLPLTRIQSLLFGRSDVELQSILDSVTTGQPATLTESAPLTQPETWQTWPITPELMLVSRQPSFQLTSGQIQAIQQILQSTRTLAVNS